MRITKHTTKKFQPFEITITVETEGEEEALRTMSLFNDSIPNLLTIREDRVIIKQFVNELSIALRNKH